MGDALPLEAIRFGRGFRCTDQSGFEVGRLYVSSQTEQVVRETSRSNISSRETEIQCFEDSNWTTEMVICYKVRDLKWRIFLSNVPPPRPVQSYSMIYKYAVYQPATVSHRLQWIIKVCGPLWSFAVFSQTRYTPPYETHLTLRRPHIKDTY